MASEYRDFLPQPGSMPRLTPDEVRRFVALAERGRNRFHSGDRAGAESSFRSQLRIFAANPEPYVSLALVAAAQGHDDAALEFARQAVIRGFTDLPSLARAEVWGNLHKRMEFVALEDAVPTLLDIERAWGGWSDFRVERSPDDLNDLRRDHIMTVAILDGMSPALGPRLTRLWTRAVDRATAAALEAYVTEKPDAPDALEAAEALMAIYAGGPDLRWERIPVAVAGRLRGVAEFVLARAPQGNMRSGALICRALAATVGNDRLSEAAREQIRESLQEVLASNADGTFLALAVQGLVRTEADAGNMDHASAIYRSFVQEHAGSTGLLDRVRDSLGVLALRAGGLPEFRTTALDGTDVGPEFLGGKVVVVDFWATWCRPCVEEFETLRRIAERHGDEVILVGVNLDRGDELPESALRAWITGRGMAGVQIHDGRSWESDLVKAFGVREIPFTVVAGPDGSILAVSERGKALEKAVARGVEAAAARP